MIAKGLLKEIEEDISEALKNDAILDLRVRNRGHWEDLLPIIFAKCHQSEAAIRADQNKKIGNYLDGQCDKGVRQGRWECNDCMWRIRENLMKGNAPEGEK
jgi:hypothetical protein